MSLLEDIKNALIPKEPKEEKVDYYYNRNKKIMAKTTLPTEEEIKRQEAEQAL